MAKEKTIKEIVKEMSDNFKNLTFELSRLGYDNISESIKDTLYEVEISCSSDTHLDEIKEDIQSIENRLSTIETTLENIADTLEENN